MSVPSNGMTRDPSISGSDSRRSTSSPTEPYLASSSRGSPTHLESIHGSVAPRDGEVVGDGDIGADPEEGRRQERRGHRNRGSSDFLLGSGPSPIKKSPRYQQSRGQDNEGGSGKGKRRDDRLLVGKQRAPHRHHRQGLSLGSSPLAMAMTSASAAEESSHSDVDRSRLAASGSGSTPQKEGVSPASSNLQHDNPPPPSIGYDTDPAQIVNLALNLSESRRRHVSGRLPSRTMSGGRKRIPTGQFAPTLGDRRQPDLPEEGLMDTGATSVSPVLDKGRRSSTGPRNVPGSFFPRFPPSSDGSRGYMDSKDKYVPFELSDATALRAEKARKHFELLYEYLRLLPHLPPLRRPSSTSSLPQTRVYNPLQYIRNRKLRFREKCPIDTESGGWHDVENVHNWVDAVTRLNREPSDDPDEYLRLPPIDVDDHNEPNTEDKTDDFEIGSASSSLRRNNGNNNTKPRRPRMDWIVRPPDLLADAAWLEEGINKSKIEDRDGNKVYPPGTEFKATGLQGMDLGISPPELQDGDVQPPPEPDHRESAPSIQTGASRDTKSIDRGRRRHKISRSIHLSHSQSPSTKAGISKWRRALSRSSSVSSGSDLESPQDRKKPGSRLNGIDTALLEKQMMDLQKQGVADQLDETQTPVKYREGLGAVGSSASKRKSFQLPPKLPSLITDSLDKRPMSVPPEGRSPISPALSMTDKDRLGRVSLEDMDTTAPNSPSNSGLFPKITINLSPPVTRSSSPNKKPLQRMIGARHDRSKLKDKDARDSLELPADNDAPDLDLSYTKSEADAVQSETYPVFDGSPKPRRHNKQDESPVDGLQRSDSTSMKGYRYPSQQESRLRGIFKGGRIAEIVGNEVSRVGDFIWKKDAPITSQGSSAASSVASDDSDGEDEKASGFTKGRPLAYFRRMPTSSDDGGRLSRKTTDLEQSKFHMPSLPNFTSSLKQDDDSGEQGTSSQPASSVAHSIDQKNVLDEGGRPSVDDNRKLPKLNVRSISPFTSDTKRDARGSPIVPKGYEFGPLLPIQDKPGKSQNRSRDLTAGPFASNRLPVTGLTNLDASSTSPQPRRPTLSKATREWSISSRSITTTADTSLADKREIARVRALLLSSGVKAHEISRRAGEIRDPPPDFLLRSRHCSKDPIPRVTRAEEYIYAARNMDYTLKRTLPSLHNSMNTFSKSTCPNLKSELGRVEKVIAESLTSRTRAAASAAEDLSTELNTTNTLAVKQLNDALDKGIRKRNRRLRWLRRVGFVILEWALVGIMWWVWLVVMVWKITRGIWRGTVSGVRWILWL
ncbi:hypothetical protein FQN54_006010 [Arachnomyces sp. PD_36]|nr:hypothetical protein FQN54_006010 [Arachnomyces sp. PD_36]